MPTTKWQKLIFAFITVFFTVHLFVFYNLSYVGGYSLEALETYGVPIFGHASPIWAVILVEFVSAFVLEIFVGSPLSARLAMKVVNPRENKPYMVETAIICATVGIMCPAMSLLATFFYNDLSAMNIFSFNATWLKTIMHNLPLAFFSQLFFIQPLVRTIFKALSHLWTPSASKVTDGEKIEA